MAEVTILCCTIGVFCIVAYDRFGDEIALTIGFAGDRVNDLEETARRAALERGAELSEVALATAGGEGQSTDGSTATQSAVGSGASTSDDTAFQVGGVAMDEDDFWRAVAGGHLPDDMEVVLPGGSPTTVGAMRRREFDVGGIRMSAEDLQQAIADGHFAGDTVITDASGNTMTMDDLRVAMGLPPLDPPSADPASASTDEPDVIVASDGTEFNGPLEVGSYQLGQQFGGPGAVDPASLRVAVLDEEGKVTSVRPATPEDIANLAMNGGANETAALEQDGKLHEVDAVAFEVGRRDAVSTASEAALTVASTGGADASGTEVKDALTSHYGLDEDELVVASLGDRPPTATADGRPLSCTAVPGHWACTTNEKVAMDMAKGAGAIDMGVSGMGGQDPASGVVAVSMDEDTASDFESRMQEAFGGSSGLDLSLGGFDMTSAPAKPEISMTPDEEERFAALAREANESFKQGASWEDVAQIVADEMGSDELLPPSLAAALASSSPSLAASGEPMTWNTFVTHQVHHLGAVLESKLADEKFRRKHGLEELHDIPSTSLRDRGKRRYVDLPGKEVTTMLLGPGTVSFKAGFGGTTGKKGIGARWTIPLDRLFGSNRDVMPGSGLVAPE